MSTFCAASLAVAVTATVAVVANFITRATIGLNWQPDVTGYALVSIGAVAWILWGVSKCRDDLDRRMAEIKLEDLWTNTGLRPFQAPVAPRLYIVGGTEAAKTRSDHTTGGCNQNTA